MSPLDSFKELLRTFIPVVAMKSEQLNRVLWILETTGSEDAALLKSSIEIEFRLLFKNEGVFHQLLKWEDDAKKFPPLFKRQFTVLLRQFKQNAIPADLIKEISELETALLSKYANFRASLNEVSLSENQIRELLKTERSPEKRKEIWAASKQVGMVLAPYVLKLVDLRNQSARHLGYSDFFHMQLDMQEVDASWLFQFLDELEKGSSQAYDKTLDFILADQSKHYGVQVDQLGPWAWAEPFCQEDPNGTQNLDPLIENVDLCDTSQKFFERMGINILPIAKASDHYEREGKNQHAFCINIDRSKDVRTLNNVQPTLKWLETLLHEYGHAIYEIGFDQELPWLLKEPPHMLTTEAMALLAGRQAYLPQSLNKLVGIVHQDLFDEAIESLKRRQLIFSRWVLVMTFFERELYQNPHQDLNKLWWDTVSRFQKISPPENREGSCDWASKFHISLAPVYYYSYLLGEVLASSLQEGLSKSNGLPQLDTVESGNFLKNHLFHPGNKLAWNELVEACVGNPLSSQAWLQEFA